MSFETTNGLKNAPKVISEGLKIKNFSGGHALIKVYNMATNL